MIEVLKSVIRKRQRLTSLLGLTLDGSRLEGVVLRRSNGSLQVQQSFSVTLSLDPLAAEAELVGREIRNHLAAAGVHERHCVVGLPLKWVLSTHVEVPPLPEADVAGFLHIEAERGFPCDAATLQISTSRCAPEPAADAAAKNYALLAGIPLNHLTVLEQALRAAKLKPVSFSLGIAALQPARTEASDGVLALALGESQVALQITCGGGVAALRTLEGALELEGGTRRLHGDVVVREARITLGQLPPGLRETVRRIRIFGPRDLAQQLADETELRLEPMGLKVELVKHYAPGEFGVQIPSDAPVSPALSLAAAYLTGGALPFEFLPPKVTAWHQLNARYSSGKLRMAGAAAGAVALIVGGLFGVQQWQLMRLRSQWNAMASQVKDLQSVQQQIRQYRPWYDESIKGLTILRQLSLAFPETGVVSAKTIEIRDLDLVTCTGLAQDYRELLRTQDRLQTNRTVSKFHLDTIRGKPPMQFTFNFHWSEGGAAQ
jgi:hypothetical protein